jgi:phage protein D/phage baseplate assembly protein gpV
MSPITLAPTITVNGQLLATSWQDDLLECKVELELRTTGQVTMRFTDPGYTLAQSGTMSLGTSVTVGVPGTGTLIEAEVTALGVEQREGEQPELVVIALDKSHRLGRGSRVKTYLTMAYSDVVSSLVSAAGLSASTDSSQPTFDYLLQVSSDLEFLNEMASRSGFDWWVDGSTLNFKKPASGTTVELTLGDALRNFSVYASGHAPGTVSVYGWDRDAQQTLTGTASSATLTASSDLATTVAEPDSAFGQATLITAGLAGSTQEEVTQLSQALIDWAVASSVRASGTTDVDPNLKLGTSVSISDAGPLSGSYPVTRVEHTYRPRRGFLTRFWSGGRVPSSSSGGNGRYGPLQGPATHHPGLVVGEVTNINDPNQMGRVKVRFPGLDTTQESAWGRLLTPGGGSSRGSVMIPEVGDEVLVAFEHGDPRQPIILGGLFGNKSTIPDWTVKDGKVSSRRFTSRLGHVWEMSDGDQPADQYFMVQLAGQQHTLKINKEATNLEIPSGQPLTIKAGNTQVAFSNTGDVTIKGANVTIQADQSLKLSGLQISVSADSQLQMQGQSQASLKGAVLQLEGEGSAALKGAIVQIN